MADAKIICGGGHDRPLSELGRLCPECVAERYEYLAKLEAAGDAMWVCATPGTRARWQEVRRG